MTPCFLGELSTNIKKVVFVCKDHIKVVIGFGNQKKKVKIEQSTRNAIFLSVNLKYQFILYKNKPYLEQQCRSDNQATMLLFLLALKHKIIRVFIIAYLHYADN